MNREIALFVAGAFAWRAFVSALTSLPSEDGANYLWMAEQFAALRPDRALDEVFPPLLSLAIAPFVALGLDPFRAGQLVGCLGGAAALVAIRRVCVELVPDSGRLAALLVLAAPLPVRFAAEVYTEPLFHACGAVAVLAGMRGKALECGLWSGLSCWLRPEGLLIAVGFAIARPRRLVPLALGAASLVLALGAWRASCGLGFVPIAKVGNILERITREAPDAGAFFLHFGANVVSVPWLWLEAFTVTGVLALLGLRSGRGRAQAPLAIVLGLAVLVVCVFLARRRFLVAWFFLVVPFAVDGFRRLPERARDPVLIVVLLLNVLLSLRIQDPDRIAERLVGEYLGGRLEPGERVAGDMTRVVYYAGQRPLPPKVFTATELVARARAPGVRWVVLGANRADTPAVVEALEGEFVVHDLPEKDREVVRTRGILVLERVE